MSRHRSANLLAVDYRRLRAIERTKQFDGDGCCNSNSKTQCDDAPLPSRSHPERRHIRSPKNADEKNAAGTCRLRENLSLEDEHNAERSSPMSSVDIPRPPSTRPTAEFVAASDRERTVTGRHLEQGSAGDDRIMTSQDDVSWTQTMAAHLRGDVGPRDEAAAAPRSSEDDDAIVVIEPFERLVGDEIDGSREGDAIISEERERPTDDLLIHLDLLGGATESKHYACADSSISYRKGATTDYYFTGVCRERRRRPTGKSRRLADKLSHFGTSGEASTIFRVRNNTKWCPMALEETGFHVSLLPRRDETLGHTSEEWTCGEQRGDNKNVDIGTESDDLPVGSDNTTVEDVDLDTGSSSASISSIVLHARDHDEASYDSHISDTVGRLTNSSRMSCGDTDQGDYCKSQFITTESSATIISPDWIDSLPFSEDSEAENDDFSFLASSTAASAYFDRCVRLTAASRRLISTVFDVVVATEGCRVPATDRRLRHKSKWRVEKARRQLKTRHCRTVSNAAHGTRMYVNHRVSKQMTMVLSAPSSRYRKETSVREIDRCKGTPGPATDGVGTTKAAKIATKTKGWTPRRKSISARLTDEGFGEAPVPRELLYAADSGNADSNLSSDVVQLLLALQHRDLSPEDYDLLLHLDDRVRPPTVDVVHLDRFRVDQVTIEDLIDEEKMPSNPSTSPSHGLEHRSTDIADNATVAFPEERQRCCGVCLEKYEVGQTRKYLPCDHSFHVDCIDHWLSQSSMNCPLDGLSVVDV